MDRFQYESDRFDVPLNKVMHMKINASSALFASGIPLARASTAKHKNLRNS